MKVMTIVGTRPELIKMSEIIKKLDKYTEHIFVHTGQNYDYELNEIFYKDLGLRKPDYYLGVAGDTLGATIGNIFYKTEEILLAERPDAVCILGDTNSALSGIITKRLKIPLFHLEAGNRCFDDNVPEEINRRILDHIADINFVYTENERHYLLNEGIHPGRIFVMGSPMGEILFNRDIEENKPKILDKLGIKEQNYFLVSIHRDENVEIEDNFWTIVVTLNEIADKYKLPIIISTHPRLRKRLEDIKFNKLITFSKPFGFNDYINLQQYAKCVISDSGTIAEESAILHFPAITIRNTTERPEAQDVGSILMTSVDKDLILKSLDFVIKEDHCFDNQPRDYQVCNSSERVVKIILGYVNYINKYIWHK